MAHEGNGTVILVTREGMGDAPPELQRTLIGAYLTLLAASDVFPETICFYGDGVKLVVEGSPVLGQLAAVEAKGVKLIACTTCLNYFEIMDKLAVGVAGGMPGIMEAQFGAAKVISL